jgi:transcriptional regulator with XRE-family HTH domain
MATKPTRGTDEQVALGAMFRRAREGAGISLRGISKDMGMSINTIRWHEAGHRSLRADDLMVAAKIIGCRVLDLIRDSGPFATQNDESSE